VTGREVEEKTFDLRMDRATGCWQLDSSGEGLPAQQGDLLKVLEEIGPASVQDLAEALEKNKGTIYHQLAYLEKKAKVKQGSNKQWMVAS